MSYCPMCGAPDSGSPCRVCGVPATTGSGQSGRTTSGSTSSGVVTPTTVARATAGLDRLGKWPLAGVALVLGLGLGWLGAASLGGSSSASASTLGADGGVVTSTSTVTSTVTETAGAGDQPGETTTVTETPTPTAELVDSVSSPTWIIVIESLPKGAVDLDQAKVMADIMTQHGQQLVVLDSDALSGLNGGYWVVGQLGYPSEGSAKNGCAEYDRDPGGRCYPRRVS